MASTPVIETHNLSKFYGKARGIDNVNLSVNEGEIFGFIGPNGAGKSTAIRTLLNLLFPTSGTGTIFGMDIVNDAPKIMKEIGYLPGEVNYYSGMTGRELLHYSMTFFGVAASDRLEMLSNRFELDLTRPFSDLSMGNKKKVAIVQSLLHSPRLLILDEPTNGLDPLMQVRFFETLREENERGVTIFFSSHILSDVQRLCHRLAVIKAGKIIATETVEGLRQKQLKKVSIRFDKAPDIESWKGDDYHEVHISNSRVEFKYSGEITRLLEKIRTANPIDVNIGEPGLEDIFMHYYEN